MPIWLQIVFGCGTFVFGATTVILALKGNKRTDTEDIRKQIERDTRVNMKLDNITTVTQNIEKDVSTVKTDIQNIDRRLVIVEQKVGSAHHRIDGLEARVDRESEV